MSDKFYEVVYNPSLITQQTEWVMENAGQDAKAYLTRVLSTVDELYPKDRQLADMKAFYAQYFTSEELEQLSDTLDNPLVQKFLLVFPRLNYFIAKRTVDITQAIVERILSDFD